MATAPTARTYPALVDELARLDGSRIAVIAVRENERTLSYAELAAVSRRVASGLQGLGVGRGDRVGLLCTNRWEWIATMLAAGRVGAQVAAFDTWSRRWDLDHLLRNSSCTVLVTLDALGEHRYVDDLAQLVPGLADVAPGAWSSDAYPRLREVVVIGEGVAGTRSFADLLAADELDDLPPGRSASAADVAFVLYTSGSTARPKGVPLVHARAIENGFNIGERMGLGRDDRVWLAAPLFWSYGSANALTATFTHGATLVLQQVFEPGEALDLIERHACTALYTLPNMTAALLAHPSFRPDRTASLRTGLTIGAPQDVLRVVEGLGAAGVCNVYGSTETYGNCCVTPSTMPLERRMDCQGPPLPGMDVRVVDPETGDDRPRGEIGDVWVAGFVTTGYVGDEALTAATFSADGYYRSGDLGMILPDGSFRFVARASDMIKTRGINVSPLEVETYLLGHEDVVAAAVVGADDEWAGQVVVAFVEVRGEVTPDELRAYCRAGMAGYKVPARITISDGLPRTDTGKLDRRKLLVEG